MIKGVISDLGKVLVNFDNSLFYRKIATFSLFSPEEIERLVRKNQDIVGAFDTGKITPEEFYTRVTQTLRSKIDYSEFYSIYNNVFSINKPVLKIYKRLKKRYRLILLSNTDTMRFNFIKKKFPQILIFDGYVLSFETGVMKPHPLIYKQALKKAEAKAEECVFIDDRKENIEGAKNLGMSTILFEPKNDLQKVLREKGIVF